HTVPVPGCTLDGNFVSNQSETTSVTSSSEESSIIRNNVKRAIARCPESAARLCSVLHANWNGTEVYADYSRASMTGFHAVSVSRHPIRKLFKAFVRRSKPETVRHRATAAPLHLARGHLRSQICLLLDKHEVPPLIARN